MTETKIAEEKVVGKKEDVVVEKKEDVVVAKTMEKVKAVLAEKKMTISQAEMDRLGELSHEEVHAIVAGTATATFNLNIDNRVTAYRL